MQPRWPDISRTAALAGLALLGLLLAGCWGEPATGPVEIRYGRDTCDVCRMIISDPRFAAQVRGGPKHKPFKFDDLGELVLWLDEQKWKDEPKTEIWVMESKRGKEWLNAKTAYYVRERHTPMDYGFGAVKNAEKDAITYEEMAAKVRERGSTYHCAPDGTVIFDRRRLRKE